MKIIIVCENSHSCPNQHHAHLLIHLDERTTGERQVTVTGRWRRAAGQVWKNAATTTTELFQRCGFCVVNVRLRHSRFQLPRELETPTAATRLLACSRSPCRGRQAIPRPELGAGLGTDGDMRLTPSSPTPPPTTFLLLKTTPFYRLASFSNHRPIIIDKMEPNFRQNKRRDRHLEW